MPPTSRSASKPTAQQVLDILARSPVPVDKRRLVKQLGLKGDGRRALTLLLRDMAREGTVANVGEGRIARTRPDRDKEAVPLEIVGTDVEDGTLLAKPLEWIGPPPLARLRVAQGHAAPTVGAHGMGKFEFVDGEWTATLVRLAERVAERVVGQIEKAGSGWRLKPTDRRVKTEFMIDATSMGEAQPGELVLAEVKPQRRLGLPLVQIVERIGRLGDPRSASLIAIHAQGIPTEFPADALEQAVHARPAPVGAREDLRDRPIVTIDGADARDFDDAVLAEPDDDPANPGGWRLIVAIADVAWYVRAGDALDRSAYERGNSCYFPDRVVPMLPERLSNDLCSLRPDEDRPTLAVHIVVDRHGAKRHHRFTRAMIRSAQRFTYERIQSIRDGHEKAPGWIADKVVGPLYGAYKALFEARQERGALDIDVEERKVELGADGKVAKIAPRTRLDSHRLIEEFMILANVCAAETLERKRVPCMYRVHEPPAVDRIEVLREVLEGLGLRLARGAAMRPHDFGRVLEWAKDQPWHHMVNQMVLRSQSLAVYSPANQGHFGLSLARYAHFTSPIRRYADLLVHRGLISADGLGEGGLLDAKNVPDFADAGDHISATERRAVSAERDAMARYIAAYLEDRQGATFPARISGVQKFGLFITLAEIGADGLVPVRSLPNDFYHFDERRHTLSGSRNGKVYTLGQSVEVRLREVDGLTGSLAFELIEAGGARPARGNFRQGRRRR
ncbi:MAG: ribonuclease R [Proteobacteria bacterium]|nr:ribonuclease R [Pseudomonadota bacterium]